LNDRFGDLLSPFRGEGY